MLQPFFNTNFNEPFKPLNIYIYMKIIVPHALFFLLSFLFFHYSFSYFLFLFSWKMIYKTLLIFMVVSMTKVLSFGDIAYVTINSYYHNIGIIKSHHFYQGINSLYHNFVFFIW